MKKILLLVSLAFVSLLVCANPEDDRGVPMYGSGYTLDDQYLVYWGITAGAQFPKGALDETIYTWKETEEVNGKTYMIVYDAYANNGYTIYKLHMRREDSQIRVIYDEYKQFMHDSRGRDMSDFDSQCQYEVTDDGEMVLYDFSMQPGDKFRSVEGREDVYVVGKQKMNQYILTDLEEPQGLLLSNGIFILDNVGAAYYKDSHMSYNEVVDVDFFDYLHLEKGVRSRELTHAQLGAIRLFDDHSDGKDVNGISSLPTSAQTNSEARIFDLGGRELKSTPASGIYIRNGKKFVVK